MSYDPYGQPPPEQQPGWQQPTWQQQPAPPTTGQPPPTSWQQPPGPPASGWQQPGWQQPGWQQPGSQQPGWQQPGWQQPGWQQPAGWPSPPPPRQGRTGLTVALIAGGLVLALCLVAGLATVAYRVLVNQDGIDELEAGEAGGARDEAGGQPAPIGDPFGGTPAALFADGQAGIRLPTAEAVGDFTVDEVAGALEQVSEALIATRIEHQMLIDHDPRDFIRLMSRAIHDHLREDFSTGNFAYYASQLANGTELAVATPRVDGTVTYEATVDSGGVRVIEIVTSFVWVYAFEVSPDTGLDGIVVVRDRLVWHLPHQADVSREATGLWLWEGEAYAWGIDCDAFDRGLLAPQTEQVTGLDGVSAEQQVFDPDASLDLPNTC